MANLRDIINAATPGPWDVYRETDVAADVLSSHDGYHDLVAFDQHAGACSPADARHIAAYSPDHALLIEAVIDELGCSLPFSACAKCDLVEVGAPCTERELKAYRKERGYE